MYVLFLVALTPMIVSSIIIKKFSFRVPEKKKVKQVDETTGVQKMSRMRLCVCVVSSSSTHQQSAAHAGGVAPAGRRPGGTPRCSFLLETRFKNKLCSYMRESCMNIAI